VDEVVEQVSIPGDDAFSPGRGIVGAEDGGHIRMLFEKVDHATYRPGRNDNIGVHKKEDLATCMPGSIVPRSRRPRVFGEPKDAHAHLGGDGRGVISGCVIYGENF
jgi:hypothetical protein